MTYIGIDISKATFVAAFPTGSSYRTETFTNDSKGIRRFIGKLSADSHHCVMKATGNYCFLLLYLLEHAGITASLVNPKKIKNYSRVMMSVTKTDDMDARLIADFGEKMTPAPYKLPSESLILLKQKKTDIRKLQKQLIATKNLQSSLEPLPVKDKRCLASLRQTVAFLEKQIKHLEAELVQTAESVLTSNSKPSPP